MAGGCGARFVRADDEGAIVDARPFQPALAFLACESGNVSDGVLVDAVAAAS